MNLPRDERAQDVEIPTRLPTAKEIARELHLFGDRAEAVWLETAAKVGSMYTDRAALRIVHEAAIAATRWATETQVLAAIRRRMVAKSTPRRIPEWSRYEASDEQQRDAIASGRLEGDEVIEGQRVAGVRHISSGVARATSALAERVAASS